jgi:hypothetical protein
MVATPDGLVPIEDVGEGTEVLSYDVRSNDVVISSVLRTFVSQEQPIVEITYLAGEAESVVRGTPTHPFWVVGYGWTAMSRLREGDLLRTLDGEAVVRRRRSLVARQTVYNIEVQDTHAYFVGTPAVLVHNRCLVAADLGFPNAYLEVQGDVMDVGTTRAVRIEWMGRNPGYEGPQGNLLQMVEHMTRVARAQGRTRLVVDISSASHPTIIRLFQRQVDRGLATRESVTLAEGAFFRSRQIYFRYTIDL